MSELELALDYNNDTGISNSNEEMGSEGQAIFNIWWIT